MDMIWPAVDCGVTFSSMGITLALIRRQLKELDKKLDLILEKDRKVALDKLSEAMISLENRNHEAARDNFQRYLFESFNHRPLHSYMDRNEGLGVYLRGSTFLGQTEG